MDTQAGSRDSLRARGSEAQDARGLSYGDAALLPGRERIHNRFTQEAHVGHYKNGAVLEAPTPDRSDGGIPGVQEDSPQGDPTGC